MKTINLRILATTDLHAHVSNYDYYRDGIIGGVGLIGLAEIIKKQHLQFKNTLLVDNGDFIQGNPIGNYLRDYALEDEHPIITLMNELHYDVGTVGNHEFDFGIDYLEKMINDIDYPIVNANISKIDGVSWLKPYVILEQMLIAEDSSRHMIKIGIVGVLPPQVMQWNYKAFQYYAEHISPLWVSDIKQTLEDTIPLMKSEGVDVVVVLAHSGFANKPYAVGDENVIQEIVTIKDIDAIVAGHAHSIFPDEKHSFAKPIVMSGAFGEYLGIIDLQLSQTANGWKAVSGESSVIQQCNEHIDLQDPLFKAIQPAHDELLIRMNKTLGESKTTFSSALSLIQDDSMTQLIADAQIWAGRELLISLGKSQYSNLPLLSAAAPFKMGGRKNAPNDYTWVEKGELTFKNIADLYPFNNQLAIITITGKELREWLECANNIYHQVDANGKEEQYLINWMNRRSYNRDVIKGITYQVNVTQPHRYNGNSELVNMDAHRIENLCYKGNPIQDCDEFLLATNQYRAFSGKFPGSGEDKVIALSTDELPTLIENYLLQLIKDVGYVEVKPDDNWQLKFGEPASLLYESSPSQNILQYIKENNQELILLDRMDSDGFTIYRFRD